MAIKYDEQSRTFTLNTDNSTYQMQVDKYGYLIHLYYGQKTEGIADYLLLFADRGYSGNPYDAGLDRTYSLDYLPQEFPVDGTGDFRSHLLSVRDKNGIFGCDLRYTGYEIEEGKYSLKGLPAVYSEDKKDDADTLKIRLKNDRTGVEVTLLYGVLPHLDIITRSVIVVNKGHDKVYVEKLGTACLDFLYGDFDLITFYGRHTMERHPERTKLTHGSHVVGSRRGYSSHEYNPFMILCDSSATEYSGRCWSMQFVYSGGFRAEAEVDQYKQTRLVMGLSEEKFLYPLSSGESITAPEVIISFSSKGLTRLSQNLHSVIREHVCRGKYKNKIRPVVFNSWEASFFDFTGESLLKLADEAKGFGADMLVVDDGWFGDRNDDLRALGDWKVNEKKLGMTLGDLVDKVNEKGLSFGIWFEPEMINEDSDLYREHPDYAMAIPGEKPVRGRNQLVLDFSRKEVVDNIYDQMCGILDQGNIEYVKWDCNRSISDVFSYTAEDQGKVLYDYMIGLYDLLERLTERYPDLLIEGCSGGGGRFDAGMLYYTPQIWCSDNTDAMDRIHIHYGTSFGYPISAIAAHVSACPNQQTGRTSSMKTRFVSAMTGAFGYELDPAEIPEDESALIKDQITHYKKYADLILNGSYYRLTDPDRENVAAWEYVSSDRSEVLLCAVLQENHGNEHAHYVVPKGLEPGAIYFDTDSDKTFHSDALMDMGFPLPIATSDGEAYIYYFKRR